MAPTVGEVVFVDTNVLVSATDESRSQHRDAYRLIAESGPARAALGSERTDSARIPGGGDPALPR